MIPLAIPNLSGNERKYLNNCIDTTFVSSVGEYVTKLEEMSAQLSGAAYGVATSSGTTALDMALIAAGVGRDDLVIIPSYTFIATANAVAHCGAIPWLMDISTDDWCMDIDLLEHELATKTERRRVRSTTEDSEPGGARSTSAEPDALIHIESGRRIAAIMPVYVHGNIPDMHRLKDIARSYDLPLIADAACAIGARLGTEDIGGLADMSAVSFNGNKTVTAGGGGVVISNDKAFIDRIRHLTTTARVWPDYDFDEVGYNYRMTNIQAAVGVAQLERLSDFIRSKQKVRSFYATELSDLGKKGITFFPSKEGCSCWFSGIILPEGTGLEISKKVCAGLKEKDIDSRTFWKPVHLQTPYAEVPRSDMTKSEGLWQRIITLPSSTNITDVELDTVAQAVRTVVNELF